MRTGPATLVATVPRFRALSTLALLSIATLAGCRAKPDSANREQDAAACRDAEQVAQLYPAARHSDTRTRAQVLEAAWAVRDGGQAHHAHDDVWRETIDLTLAATGEGKGSLEVKYNALREHTGDPDKRDEWTKRCEICGDLLVCGDFVSTMRVRKGELTDRPMTWLDTTALVTIGENRFYVLRFGHEIAVELDGDPAKVDGGSAKVSLRKLEPGASVVTETVPFEVDADAPTRREVSLTLPGQLGRLRFDLRDDGVIFMRGGGAPEDLPDTLFHALQLAAHPHLGSQPKMP